MADASLLARYEGAAKEQTNSAAEQLRSQILRSSAPEWSQLSATRSCAQGLRALSCEQKAVDKKAAFASQPALLKACLEVLGEDAAADRWVVTLLCDMVREDSSCFAILEEALGKGVPVFQTLFNTVMKPNSNSYVPDKAAWLLSSIIGNVPRFFDAAQVSKLVEFQHSSTSPCSELGVLESYVNLMKADSFRSHVWKIPGVSERITGVTAQKEPQYLYKCIFAMWLLSFEEGDSVEFHPDILVRKIKGVLAESRFEKVVRLSLTVLKNFLGRKAFSEQVVEQGLLEVVQQLEYEKWRDSELYDEIRDLAGQISVRTSEMSNFERYQKELHEGQLKWGFIHSAKFWAENALKFEQNSYQALKELAILLKTGDNTTKAVACHDLGEFVVCHPLGKKTISDLGVKGTVMELMASKSPEHREVRREALLCCQKFMLNKWGDMDTIAAA